jgi:hypothetical protein
MSNTPPVATTSAQGLPLTVSDLVCVLDLDPNGNETTSDLQSLEQDVLHILIELFASNPDDPDRGVGIDQYLSGTQDDLSRVPRIIENQLDQDDRIDGVSANLVQQADGLFVLSIVLQVDGTVIGLHYGYVQGAGIAPLNPLQGGP